MNWKAVMERRRIIFFIVSFLIFFLLAVKTFPSVLKIQFSFPQETDLHIYEILADDRELLDLDPFYGNVYVIPIQADELRQTGELQVKFQNIGLQEQTEISPVTMSLGNYIFYEGDWQDSSLFFWNSLGLDEEGCQQVTGDNPYIQIKNPAELLETFRMRIYVEHFVLWAGCFVLFCAVALVCGVLKKKELLFVRRWRGQRQGAEQATAMKVLYLPVALGAFLAMALVIGSMNRMWFHFQELQNSEIYVLAVMLGLLFWLLMWRTDDIWLTVFATCLIGIGMLLAIKGMTTFLTVDEHAAIKEQAKLKNDWLRHWYMNSSRMNYAIMGTFWAIFPREWFEQSTGLDYKQIGKLAHWLIGSCLLLFTGDLVQTRLLNRHREVSRLQIACNYIGILLGTFLLPVVTIALKSYNYDLFMVAFCGMGAVYALLAFQEGDMGDGIRAAVFSFLGCLEKVIGTPVLLIAMSVLAYTVMRKYRNNRKKSWLVGYLAVLAVIGIFFAISYAIQYLVQVYLMEGRAPICTIVDAVYKVYQKFMMPCSQAPERMVEAIGIFLLQWLALGLLFTIAGAVLNGICVLYERQSERVRGYLSRLAVWLTALYALIGLVCAVAGVGYSERVSVYLLYVIENYALALPTVFTLLLFVFAIASCRRSLVCPSLCWSMVIVTWGVLPAYLIYHRWNPTWVRYIDLYLYLLVLLVIVTGLPVVYGLINRGNILAGMIGALGLFHMWEVSGSMPAFTYFAPGWYGITTLWKTEAEREMGIYWGENRASLGSLTLDYCEETGMDTSDLRFYYGYYRGTWLTKPDYVTVMDNDWNEDYGSCGVEESDFYIFDTQSIQRGMVAGGWPEAEPIITVKYRNYVVARIYQGSQLEAYFDKK